MPFKRHLLTAVAFALCASLGRAAVPSKHEVLQAIAVMEKSISGPQAVEAAKTIVVYAQSSDDVLVNIGPDELPWLDEDWGLGGEREQSCKSLLLAAFVAGNVKSQIKNEKAEDDTYSGWLFAIDTYTRLRAKEGFTSPSMDSLAKMRADGTLLQHARDVRSKEEQEEQADEQKKPMA
ncbi:MAG: hypothetical protein ABSF76_08605 [Opitutaceae bacterium]|jgi:hypothetical protein